MKSVHPNPFAVIFPPTQFQICRSKGETCPPFLDQQHRDICHILLRLPRTFILGTLCIQCLFGILPHAASSPTSSSLPEASYPCRSWKHCGDPHVLDLWCESYWCPGKASYLAHNMTYIIQHEEIPALQRNFDSQKGCRVGEAANPGPTSHKCQIKMAIVNPTSVRDKKQEFQDLIQHHGCNFIGLSETSATWQTQKEITHQIRRLKCKALWSPPVPAQRLRLDGEASKRGRAGGTAVFTSLPARLSRIPEKEIGHLTNRLVHVIIQVGGISFQVLVIYGVTTSNANALAVTEELIQEAILRSRRLHLPAIFMGDFNMEVDQSQAFQQIFNQGYRHLKELYQTTYGRMMPPTCNEVTHPDTAVVHPMLIPWIQSIEVNKDKMFDTHDPVFIAFQFPGEQLFVTRYSIPKSWENFQIDTEDLTRAFDKDKHNQPSDIDQWCQKCERIVDIALKQTHHDNPHLQPVPCLPKKCKGRGFKNSPKKFPAQAHVKQGRAGDYEPPGEVSSIRTKRQVTQLRRVQSLFRRVKKLENMDEIWEHTQVDIQREWTTICSSTCMGVSFWKWAQHQPEIGPLTLKAPSSTKLFDVYQILKLYVDDAVYMDSKIRKNLARWGKIEDQTTNYSKAAFAIARGASKPPLNKIATNHEEEALIIGEPNLDETGETVMELAVNNPEVFNINFPVDIREHLWWIREKNSFSIVVTTKSPPDGLEESCHIHQKIEHVDHQFIFQKLDSYWHTFWSRDPQNDNPTQEEDEKIQKILSAIPSDIQIDQITDTNLDDWMDAIKTTKTHSAPGVDGIRASELKMLPREMIKLLVEIMSSDPQLLPIQALVGRTIPLPKSWEVEDAGRTRPITILPQLYRIWGKVISTQAIKQLSYRLPGQISGFLKGRSAFKSAYDTQVWLEFTAQRCLDKSGVTLDLTKCYNLIRRCFAVLVLQAFNLGDNIINKWKHCMQHLIRFWEIDGQISQPSQTTTGCAEGDPIAVIIMIAIATCWVYQTPFDHQDLRINAFADNWSWASLNVAPSNPFQRDQRNL